MAENHAKILYKVVCQKTAVAATESDAVKENPDYQDHGKAYKPIFGLTLTAERYVNGRKVEADGSPDVPVTTYIQTASRDTDMLDYQLYEMQEDHSGNTTAVLVYPQPASSDDDPAETGGLFTFEGHLGARYVLVCSQAYRLVFLNDTTPTGIHYSFRVRKGEAPADDAYRPWYSRLPVPDPDYTSPAGIHYYHPVWSYAAKPPEEPEPFDDGQPVTKKTYIHAYYQNDQKEVDQSRKKLEAAVVHGIEVGEDHFLRLEEQAEVLAFVRDAQAVLDQKDPMAVREDLEEAIGTLKDNLAEYESLLKERYQHYSHLQDDKIHSGSGGTGGTGSGGTGGSGTGSGGTGSTGSGGAGGSGTGGSGTGGSGKHAGGGGGNSNGGMKKNPYGAAAPKNVQTPLKGTWEIIPGEAGASAREQFLLNGTELLRDCWARLYAPKTEAAGGAEAAADQGQDVRGPAAEASGSGPGWYHFDQQGRMQTGWFCDKDGSWYYLNAEPEGDRGRMQTGFIKAPGDPQTYYLDPGTGAMATGWREINGSWYYFNPDSGNVYFYDAATEQWSRSGAAGRPSGAMFENERTPDGYHVGADGRWIQGGAS